MMRIPIYFSPLTRACAAIVCAVTLAACARAEDWPHWRGPNRNGVTSEPSGYSTKAWPLKEPVWTVDLAANGENSPIAVDGRLYTIGYKDEKDTVYCLDAKSGARLWTQSYAAKPRGRNSVGDYNLYVEGPMASPEYDAATGYLYTTGVDGELNCWDTRKQGARVWGFNLYDAFGMAQRPFTGGQTRDYGYTTTPYVHDKWVIIEVGGKSGCVMAFDKLTGGKPVGTPAWRSANTDPPGHTGGHSPIKVGSVSCMAVFTLYNLLIVRLDAGHAGETMAEYAYKPGWDAAVVTPSVWSNLVIMSTHYAPSNDLVAITPGVATKRGTAPHSEVGVPVYHNGRIYKASGMLEGWLANTSEIKRLWIADSFGDEGTVILTGDNKLIASGASKLALYGLDGAKLAETIGPRIGWPSPVIADGRLFTRTNGGVVRCYRLR